jgi:uncharacterized protein YrrD
MTGYRSSRQGKNMLYDLNALIGSPVIAKNGETGSIHDFLFDDQSWKVLYLVVYVGNWLTFTSGNTGETT